MSRLPPEPVPPQEFMGVVLPALLADVEPDPSAEADDLKVGIALTGPDGGEWTLQVVDAALGIVEGRAEDCAVTLVQSVEDWRSALWEGRPELVSDLVRQSLETGADASEVPGFGPPQNPDALRELEKLPGRIDAILAGEEGHEWRVGIHVGPGPIPEAPQATIRVGAEQAEQIRRGELHPLEALITGQLRLEGDLGLILQLQAIAMAASMPPPERS